MKTVCIEGDRQSGKTELLLEMSIAKARKGVSILYVGANMETVNHTFRRAISMLDSIGKEKILRSRGKESIVFTTGGQIRFVSVNTHTIEGSKVNSIVLDDVELYAKPDLLHKLASSCEYVYLSAIKK